MLTHYLRERVRVQTLNEKRSISESSHRLHSNVPFYDLLPIQSLLLFEMVIVQ